MIISIDLNTNPINSKVIVAGNSIDKTTADVQITANKTSGN